jgi:hypothetical protein
VVAGDDGEPGPAAEAERSEAERERRVGVDDGGVGVPDCTGDARKAEPEPVVERERERANGVLVRSRVVSAGVGVDDVHPAAAVAPRVAPRLHRVRDAVDRRQVCVGERDDRLWRHRPSVAGMVGNRLWYRSTTPNRRPRRR